MQRWLLLRDAPRHTELRRLMNRGFTPAVIERTRSAVEEILEQLLDAAPGSGPGSASGSGALDLIRDVAYPFPVRVICELLGLPRETHDRCVVLSDDTAGWFGNLRWPPDLARVAQAAIRELETLFSQTIRERRGHRGDDLLSLLIAASESSQLMSHEELLAQCVMLLFAGHETTRNLIGNGLYSLLVHAEACEQLRGDAHVCGGSTLARLEGRLAIGGVLRRYRTLRLVDPSPYWGPNFALRGLKSLRVDT